MLIIVAWIGLMCWMALLSAAFAGQASWWFVAAPFIVFAVLLGVGYLISLFDEDKSPWDIY